ncbi:MAG: DUF3786 domain-containing protein [Deltaproteobacteria bacterium]|jgi:hypothetical protein|nr:DUF3786 domain-containing protein [Deltaproteobacteria bacterium]
MTEVKLPFPQALWEDLSKADPLRAAQNSGATFENGRFEVSFLGAPFVVDLAERTVIGPPTRKRADFQRALVLVVYLAHCGQNQTPEPAGRFVGPLEIPGGAMFFRGPHVIATAPLEEAYGKNPEALAAKAFSLGAQKSPDYLFAWRVLPKIDLACVLYPEDEEFPAQASYLVDAHANFFMPLDALWGLINVVTLELLPTNAEKTAP